MCSRWWGEFTIGSCELKGKARVNANDQVAIVFSFKSDLFREWLKFPGTIAKLSKIKLIPAYFRHFIENCCVEVTLGSKSFKWAKSSVELRGWDILRVFQCIYDVVLDISHHTYVVSPIHFSSPSYTYGKPVVGSANVYLSIALKGKVIPIATHLVLVSDFISFHTYVERFSGENWS